MSTPFLSSPFLSRNLPQLQKYIPLSWKQKQDLIIITQQLNQNQIQQQPKQKNSEFSCCSKDSHRTVIGGVEEQESIHFVDSIVSSLNGFTSQGDLFNAFKAFCHLQLHIHNLSSSSSFSKIDSSSSVSYDYSLLILHPISTLLLSCTTLKSLEQGKQLHAHIFHLGLEANPVLLPKLITFYTKFCHLTDAHVIVENSNVLHSMPWNLLISAYVKNGYCGKAISAYKQMLKMGIRPDNYTYPSVLKACADQLDVGFGREVHRSIDHASGSCLQWSLFVQNALVAMYAKCGEVEVARDLFERMPEKDVVSWNSIILGYASKGMWPQAFGLFERILKTKQQINLVTWNTIAGGHLQTGNYKDALDLISRVRSNGIHLDSVAMVIGLGACSRIGIVKLGKELHGSSLRNGCDGNETVTNALITMYSRCKDLQHAHILFRSTEIKSLVTWNAMITGYSHLNQYGEASFIFKEMLLTGVQPNFVTVASILPLCARVANLQHGKEFHCYITRHGGFKDYLLPWNSLVDMYSKSGRISEAQKLFDLMNEKDEVTYTSLIAGYGVQGEGQVALKLFEEMKLCGIKPDHITMVALLSACSHSGLVSEGQILFETMTSLYGINPRMEHFDCMIDLFGRAGLLRKAEDIIKAMPFRPSAALWATLIGACRIHRNTEIGEWAAAKLLDMRPANSGYYVLIANMYADAGCWSKVAEVRTFMRDLGVRKAPGCAWVDVGNGFQLFLVGDRTNKQAQEIYRLLEGLAKLMREDGYISIEDFGLAYDEFEE